jgi:hypothetical protein
MVRFPNPNSGLPGLLLPDTTGAITEYKADREEYLGYLGRQVSHT